MYSEYVAFSYHETSLISEHYLTIFFPPLSNYPQVIFLAWLLLESHHSITFHYIAWMLIITNLQLDYFVSSLANTKMIKINHHPLHEFMNYKINYIQLIWNLTYVFELKGHVHSQNPWEAQLPCAWWLLTLYQLWASFVKEDHRWLMSALPTSQGNGMHLFKDCDYAKRMICKFVVSTFRYSRTRNSEFVESNSFKLCSQLCESNFVKMDFQKEERDLQQVFQVNNEG